MSKMFPLIDVLGEALHGVLWGFRTRRYRPAQPDAGEQSSQARTKSQA
jgi:hypothetical protein